MIKTIEINNFQSHSNTVLEMSPGVNVIKGRSNSGKSSIIRALRWALLNDPSKGDYFVSRFASGKEMTSVGIEFDDESYIVRKKGKGVNGYDLSTGDLPVIGSDLPEEVKSITRMNSINIQDQDEQYYMIKETPGKVAKELNKLVGLDIIDETISRLNKIENENSVELKLLEKDIDEINEGLKNLDFVDKLEKDTEEIEELWKKYEELSKRKNGITHLAEEIESEEECINEINEWLTIKVPVNELKKLINQYDILKKSLHYLDSIYSDINNAEDVQLQAGEQVDKLVLKRDNIINSKEYKNQFCPECGAFIEHWRK